MSNPRAAGPWHDDGPTAFDSRDSRAWERKRDVIREIIRAEVDRARPIEDARRSIELIVETSIRPIERDGETHLQVVDDQMHPRRVEDNGATRDFTIRDLVQELRGKHPKLFQEQSPETGPMPAAAYSPVSAGGTGPVVRHVPQEPPPAAPEGRDWLDLTSPSPSAQSQNSPAQSPRVALADKLRSLERARQQPLQIPPIETHAPIEPSSPVEAAPPLEARSPFAELKLDIRSQAPPAPRTDRSERRELPDDFLLPPDDDLSERRPRRLAALAGLLLLVGISSLAYWGFRESPAGDAPVQDVAATAAPQPEQEFSETSSIQTREDQKPPTIETDSTPSGPLQGVPEVLDTATLFLQGKIVPLFGVEWVRGAGSPEDLARYINGREVVCEEATSPGSYRCKADTQDLSKVVLYNGGGRAKPEATPELKAAESAARNARRGVWASNVGGAQP